MINNNTALIKFNVKVLGSRMETVFERWKNNDSFFINKEKPSDKPVTGYGGCISIPDTSTMMLISQTDRDFDEEEYFQLRVDWMPGSDNEIIISQEKTRQYLNEKFKKLHSIADVQMLLLKLSHDIAPHHERACNLLVDLGQVVTDFIEEYDNTEYESATSVIMNQNMIDFLGYGTDGGVRISFISSRKQKEIEEDFKNREMFHLLLPMDYVQEIIERDVPSARAVPKVKNIVEVLFSEIHDRHKQYLEFTDVSEPGIATGPLGNREYHISQRSLFGDNPLVTSDYHSKFERPLVRGDECWDVLQINLRHYDPKWEQSPEDRGNQHDKLIALLEDPARLILFLTYLGFEPSIEKLPYGEFFKWLGPRLVKAREEGMKIQVNVMRIATDRLEQLNVEFAYGKFTSHVTEATYQHGPWIYFGIDVDQIQKTMNEKGWQ